MSIHNVMIRGAIAVILAAIIGSCAATATWDVYSDTWSATDALGRRLPGCAECGPPRVNKTVGIFYFLWLGQHGTDGPFDITKLLAENPDNPNWGPPGAFHHWGESELGYYLSTDEFVIRKHCQMLVDAGVDVLIMDVTNSYTYKDVYMTLLRVFDTIRKEGGKTPEICFLAHTGEERVVQTLYDDLYSKNLYPHLLFRWQGKPLILAKPDGMSKELRDYFAFRESWAWSSSDWFGDGRDKWPWLDHYPQKPGWHIEGTPEHISVCVAQHPVTNIGRSFHNGRQPAPKDFRTNEGLCFAEQWERALEVDPEFIFITGWNEWVAQRFISDGKGQFLGHPSPAGESYFIDAYNQEYSRDIEPMKGGHSDNYYYQMVSNIRRFKGVRKPEAASPPKTIQIDGNFADWQDVKPEFRDTIGDTAHRDHPGWGEAGTYKNDTGRNDFVRLKVAYDDDFIYFYAETKGKISSYKHPNWMLLFIDSDCNSSTGWQGYDYLINASVINSHTTTLKRNTGGCNWETVSKIPYRVSGNKMEIKVPRRDIDQSGRPAVFFEFHWADNIQKLGDIIEFSVSGDSAPNRRFNYRFSNVEIPDAVK